MHKVAIIFGILGIVSLTSSLLILADVCQRFQVVERESANIAYSVALALERYDQVLNSVARRQTFLEDAFSTSEQLHLTITQLREYNQFRVPQNVFTDAKATPATPMTNGQGGE